MTMKTNWMRRRKNVSPTRRLKAIQLLNRFQLNRSEKKTEKEECVVQNLFWRRERLFTKYENLFFHFYPFFSVKNVAQIEIKVGEEEAFDKQPSVDEGNECVNWVIGLKVFVSRVYNKTTE
jgi:hypothetical protein